MNLLSMMGLDENILADFREKVEEFVERQKRVEEKLDKILEKMEKDHD